MCIRILLLKVLLVNICLFPWYDTPGSQFFKCKISITELNQSHNYFNPLVSGSGRLELLKKTLEVENLVTLSIEVLI